MLKALELVGFKSFADKTRFDFPAGITVVVGPNGSGKSNIVDAIKWVLGEQRARSLRGKEMADVIFKGSGSGTRKPANTAEATIIFDNSENLLQIDAPEVHVTRRVYRSGEGEYLVNGSACRLRDVKDLFRGTGVGTDAYSLIEQGKVDNLLQASPRDRRAIFEEAAGISRFKAKKVEAQRRLERVEQNLLRLSDIVEEVDGRLRRLKSQASKARRYKEHSDRLQALRTQVGRVDWQRLTTRLQSAEDQMAACAAEIEQGNAALEAAEANVLEIEAALASAEGQLRQQESLAGRNRERLAALVSTVEHQQAHLLDLEEELSRYRQQLLAMTSRAGDLQSQLRAANAEFAGAEQEHQEKLAVLQRHQNAIDERSAALQEAKARTARQRAQFVELMRQADLLGNQISSDESVLQTANASRTKLDAQRQGLAVALQAAREETAALSATAGQLEQQLEDGGQQVAAIRQHYHDLKDKLARQHEVLSESNERRAAIGERAKLIEEIEDRMEGVGSGVQEVLLRAREEAAGPFAGVRGMVADLLEVTHTDLAELVAVALGNYAEHVVVAGAQLIELFARGQVKLPGRVGFLRLQSTPPPRNERPVSLEGQSGVIGRADRFVRTAPEYHHLVQWVLADTWFVETLSDALQFRRSLSVPVRFVTRAGELLDCDGRLLVGPSEVAVGLIARRAELRELTSQLVKLDKDIAQQRSALASLRTTVLDAENELEKQQRAQQALAGAHAEARLRFAASQERVTQIQQQYDLAQMEHSATEEHARDADGRLAEGRQRLGLLQTEVAELESTLATGEHNIQALEAHLDAEQRDCTAAKVVVARSEQRFGALRIRQAQLQRDQDERTTALAEARRQTRRCEQRKHENEAAILQATAGISELSVQDEAHANRLAELSIECAQLKASRSDRLDTLSELRQRLRTVEQQKHSRDLEAEKIRHERQAVAERLQEDYGISIADLPHEPSAEERAAREQVDAEITELRRKLTHLGSVNMEALDELSDLEVRHGSLASQYRDLVDAKQSLERIIHKINSDSRRLFSETLEQIRANFQVLFRKVFGGGRADIVLEDGVDILDAGIDIVATPPGKNSLGLSLLSGGERALTAVTLLLAIFEYRPSPFCVLDEVDGPLDEANIGRFLDVLFEFLDWTKFVVVTHSKKTMTAAHTLYGVTMQESGVSKRVSVRFEDVNEQGEISAAALRRTGDVPTPSNDDERGAA